MNWVPLPNNSVPNLSDRPRLLTDNEITFIVEHLPEFPGADKASASLARNGVIDWLRKSLQKVKLSPSAIPALAEKIKQQHKNSLCQPGSPVGVTAGEAVGATTTQTTLNTFHTSGSSKSASVGIDAMRDIIFARKEPKNPACFVYFNNKRASYEQILDTRIELVGSMVADFVKDYDIDSPDNLTQYWWQDPTTYRAIYGRNIPQSKMVMRLYLDLSMMYKHRVSIKQLAETLTADPLQSADIVYGPMEDAIIDIYPILDSVSEQLKNPKGKKREGKKPVNLFHPDVAELTYLKCIVQPELKNIRVKGINGINNLSPIKIPVLSVLTSEDPNGELWTFHLNPDKMRAYGINVKNVAALVIEAGMTVENATDHTLVIRGAVDNYRLNEKIVLKWTGKYYQRRQDLVSIEKKVYKIGTGDNLRKGVNGYEEIIAPNITIPVKVLVSGDELFIEVLSTDLNKYLSATYQPFNSLAELNDYVENESFLYEQLPSSVKVRELSPRVVIEMKIKEQKDANRAKLAKIRNDRIEKARTLPKLLAEQLLNQPIELDEIDYNLIHASELYYAETEGINLRALLNHPMVDKKLTSCNNMYVIAEVLGIEATRKFIAKQLYDTITNNGSYVHPSNILLMAEFFTSRGEPHGATYTGISRQPAGHLSLATLERAATVFTENALFARKEDVRNLSAAIVMGARCAIGDGYFDIGYDIIKDGKQEILLNDDIAKGFKSSENYTPPVVEKIDENELLNVDTDQFDLFENEKEADLFKVYADVKGEVNIDVRDVQKFGAIGASSLKDDSFVKIGIPQNKLNIVKDGEPQKIISEGLVAIPELKLIIGVETLPEELQQLLQDVIGQQIKMLVSRALPEVDLSSLPDISMVFTMPDMFKPLDMGPLRKIDPRPFMAYFQGQVV